MESLLEYLRRRAASTWLVSYGVFWCIYHWQGIYATLFVDQGHLLSKYNMLKNEYVDKYFFGFDWSSIWSLPNLQVILGLLVPAALAYMYVWWLPRFVINPAYRKEIQYKTDRKIDRLNEEKRISKQEADVAEKKTKSVDAEIELSKKRAEAVKQDPAIGWHEEYRKFATSGPAINALDNLLECVYEQDGYMHMEDEYSGVKYSLPSDAKMYADTWGLAVMKQNTISLTDKGRFFAQQYKTSIKNDEAISD